jgi:hypothetical protein
VLEYSLFPLLKKLNKMLVGINPSNNNKWQKNKIDHLVNPLNSGYKNKENICNYKNCNNCG